MLKVGTWGLFLALCVLPGLASCTWLAAGSANIRALLQARLPCSTTQGVPDLALRVACSCASNYEVVKWLGL